MKIGEEIKQSQFQSEHQKALINLLFTYNWFKNRMSGFMKDYGLTQQQYNVLRILRGQHPNGITTWEIRERMLDKMSDASRLVDRLEKMKLVVKQRNKEDRRLVVVKITDAGLTLLEQVSAKEHELNSCFDKNLTEQEARTLSELLDKIRG